jgi:long-chain fatty acid transport protein
MHRIARYRRKGLALWVVVGVALAAPPLQAAGFGLFEQGTRAMGMAGAFTAQADDPSAMFHNVGGLAFLDQREFMAGTTLITHTKGRFLGAEPFPGPGVEDELAGTLFFPSHLYYVEPLGSRFSFGLSFFTPFGLATEWDDPDTFSGRFISYQAELVSFDLAANLGWRATDNLGIGAGFVARASSVELRRRAGLANPFESFRIVDVADIRLESDREVDFGFTLGILHRLTPTLSWGLSYRSRIRTDYSGVARLAQISTGYPELDAVVAASLPFDRDIGAATSVEFPDLASFGVAVQLNRWTLMELDINWAGWSSFDAIRITFDPPAASPGTPPLPTLPDIDRPEEWRDAWSFRLGLRYNPNPRSQFRFGYVRDQTPQPSRAAGPLLPDNSRNGFTVGYGFQGEAFYTDLALMYLPFKTREVEYPHSVDNFFGTYRLTAWLLGVTVGWRSPTR